MTSTIYSHKYSENKQTGVYQFDCVGSVDYFLKLGAPQGLAAIRSQLKIRNGYVPSPPLFYKYIQSNQSPLWKQITNYANIRPGDVVIMNDIISPDDGTPGHAMIAASWPLLLNNGTYALTVYDSTGTPHGKADSRRWDSRTTPLPPKSQSGAPTSQQSVAKTKIGSGLGQGTIQLWPKSASTLSPKSEQMSWTVGTRPVKTGIAIARVQK